MNQKIPDQAEKLRQLVAQESSDPPDSGAQSVAVMEPPAPTADTDNEIFTPTATDDIPRIDPAAKINAPAKLGSKITTAASPKLNAKQQDADNNDKPDKTAQPKISKNQNTIVIETPKSDPAPINDLTAKNQNQQRRSAQDKRKNKNGSAKPQQTVQPQETTKAAQPLNALDAQSKTESPPKQNAAPLKPEVKAAALVVAKTIVPAEKVRAKTVAPVEKDKSENSSVIASLMETHRFPMNNDTQVIAITGGKGGVGKSNIACNLAIAMSQMGKNVMVLDADLSLANVDVLLGLTPRLNLSHVISGEKKMSDITIKGPAGIHIIPGGSGVEELSQLNIEEMNRLFDAFGGFTPPPDILLIDTAAGIHPNVMQFLSAADKIIVVTTPEPTAYTDAYALIKTLLKHGDDREIGLLINMAQNAREASEVLRLMLQMCRQFLDLSFNNIGFVPRDPEVLKAVRYQKPFLLRTPNSPASQTIRNIAATILQIEVNKSDKRGLKRFFSNLFRQTPPKEKVV